MKKKIYILIIILILIFIILNIYKSKDIVFDDISIFSLWNDLGENQEYKINPEKQESIEINVFQTVKNSVGIHKKVAPGSFGEFTIKLIKPKEAEYKIKLKDITDKPQNLVFILNGNKYESITEMENKLNIIFQTNNIATIKWEWKYENDEYGNMKDTEDGEKAQKYIFEIKAIIEEVENET